MFRITILAYDSTVDTANTHNHAIFLTIFNVAMCHNIYSIIVTKISIV